jgi:hypothetical protein
LFKHLHIRVNFLAAKLIFVPHCTAQLAHNDPLLLADVPYQYAIEFRNNDEARFPELFKPQVGVLRNMNYDVNFCYTSLSSINLGVHIPAHPKPSLTRHL